MLNKNKMLFLTIIFAVVIGSLIWKIAIENSSNDDVAIPASSNIDYSTQIPIPSSVEKIISEFEKIDNQPVLLYLYTTWCQVCNKNFSIVNEIAQEFQNTELKVMAIAIDRNLDVNNFNNYVKNIAPIYFEPIMLENRNGFNEFLKQKKVNYTNRIPYTVLFKKDGSVALKYSGLKSKKYLRRKIIAKLYPKK